ncbi:uncharacterized protein LOC107042036 [Diachasma alloeum]|uniref:uncharacterized protein LOC107042036 n=1 Tax=Diachasma alloeum TaxID=454923 RepID=UPI00073817F7|nr:uncharacterized protein LOC107042036 [Diachasma alloeum]
MIDTGSHRSYILEQVAESQAEPSRTMVHSLFGGSQTRPQEHKGYRVHVRSLDHKYACNFLAYEQGSICQAIPRIAEGPWLDKLEKQSTHLTDIGQGHQPISLLIGADIVGKLYTGHLQDLDEGIIAVETRLGWTILGKTTQATTKRTDTALLTFSMFAQEATVSRLWDLDVLGITDPVQRVSKEAHQQQVLEKFHDTTRVNSEGRYEVLLPWKENYPTLPDNRFLAQKRLEATYANLEKRNLVKEYEDVFQGWLQEGIIERVPQAEVENKGHYLPRRSVIKENSTTRIRPVFDASARTKSDPSLNECLETGPNLIELIPSLLLRFREQRIGVISDIQKAFLQISVNPEDRDTLRFLWKPTSNPQQTHTYRHRRVVFGVSSSPFLLGATIDLHLNQAIEKSTTEHRTTVLQKLRKSFYVDNCVTSVHSLEEFLEFKNMAIKTLQAGGFNLRGWECTHSEEAVRESSVLGLTWNRHEDTLALAKPVDQVKKPAAVTKREILSATQSLFDPLGMVCPVLICPKVLIQKLWSKDLDWDSSVDQETRSVFNHWLDELSWLGELKIPRWSFGGGPSVASVSLHAFVDASQEAYASVIFARVEVEDNVECHFIMAKSRVAPKVKPTIPRLELLAATVGARLMESVVTALGYEGLEQHFWTDSSTCWPGFRGRESGVSLYGIVSKKSGDY